LARLENFRVPMWEAVCELAKKAASAFWPVGAVGWDIAVTREGPVLVEGNTVWDPVAPLYFPLPVTPHDGNMQRPALETVDDEKKVSTNLR
jgi:Sugar-transfer associated ATP-grasp